MKFPIAVAAGVALAGCASPPPPYDYGPYLAHMPRSILVIPPRNESPEPIASYSFLSTITFPIAERGYYVFPVAVVAELMKQNGCPTPGEMNEIPPAKLREVFGADAVLYLDVKSWGTEYRVLDSVTTVSVTARLVDLRTGDEFWANSASIQKSSSEGQNNVIAMLAAAVSASLVMNSHHGMLLGPYHPNYALDQEARRAAPAGPPPKLPDPPPAQ